MAKNIDISQNYYDLRKEHMKKLLTTILSLLILLTLTGCGTEHTGYNGFSFDYPSDWIVTKKWEPDEIGLYKEFSIKSKKNSATTEDAYNFKVQAGEFGNSKIVSLFYTMINTMSDGLVYEVDTGSDAVQLFKYYHPLNPDNLAGLLYVYSYGTDSCRSYWLEFNYNGASEKDIQKILDSIPNNGLN